MRPIVVCILMLLCHSMGLKAQTYMEHLRKNAAGQGHVTVNQSAEIDELVNGKEPEVAAPAEKPNAAAEKDKVANHAPVADNKAKEESDKPDETESVDTRKKVIKGGVKMTGYRVQVFAGGNSRADRQKAERIGNAVKRRFPEYPVYVHFYSPRWICRMGNFRTLDEANAILHEIREMGYKAACVVKGTITVQQ